MKETIPLIDWRHGHYKLIPTKLGKQVWVQTRLILLYSSSLASQKQAEVSAPAVRAQLENGCKQTAPFSTLPSHWSTLNLFILMHCSLKKNKCMTSTGIHQKSHTGKQHVGDSEIIQVEQKEAHFSNLWHRKQTVTLKIQTLRKLNEFF